MATKKKPVKSKKKIVKAIKPIKQLKTPKVKSVKAEVLSAEDEVILKSQESALTPRDPLAAYLAEIKKYPLLTKEKELEIATKYYANKDPELAQILVTSNLRFVVKIAAEYAKFGAKLLDLVQEGNVGLMHAVKDFNPYKGVRLITYAVWWIRGYIREYLLKQFSMVKIGTTQDQKKLFYNLKKEKEAIRQEGLEESTKLISHRMGVSEKDIRMMEERLSSKDVSLDQPLDDENKSSLMDLQRTTDEQAIDEQLVLLEQLELLKKNIDAIRSKLNERELFLLEHRLLADNPLTLQEVGDKYKITREAVRQTEERLIAKIKEQFMSMVQPELLLESGQSTAPEKTKTKTVN